MVIGAFFNVNTTMIFGQSNCNYMVAIGLKNFPKEIFKECQVKMLDILLRIMYIVQGECNGTNS